MHCIAASTRNNCGSMTRSRIDPWVFLVWAFLCVRTLSKRCSVDLLALCSRTYSFPWGPISIQCVFVLNPDFLPFLHGTNIFFEGGGNGRSIALGRFRSNIPLDRHCVHPFSHPVPYVGGVQISCYKRMILVIDVHY